MPQTRTAFPRCTVALDENGQECFRIMALWVLMDTQNRTMVLPGKSGVEVPGMVRGNEPQPPRALPAFTGEHHITRTVGFGELDRNLHMNNTKYLDWVMDLCQQEFHAQHPVQEFTVCYLSEAKEGQTLTLHYTQNEQGSLQVDGHREKTDVSGEKERVFAASVSFL